MEEMYLKLHSLKEPFKPNQNPHLEQLKSNIYKNFCKDGGILKTPIMSIIFIPISIFLGYRTYCRVPKKLAIYFLIFYIPLILFSLYDVIYNNVSSNKKIEKKCLDVLNKRIRNNTLWTIYNIVNIIIGFIILYYGFISLFMNMKLNNCPHNMFSTFSKK
jgi:hypothetical protein